MSRARRWTEDDLQRLRRHDLAGVRPRAATELAREMAREQRERHVLALLAQLQALGIAGQFEREYRFHPQRLYRFDLYHGGARLGVELHGGIFTGGRHVRGVGFAADRQRMNSAVELGYRVLEYTPGDLADGSACAQIERLLRNGGFCGAGD